MPTSLQFGICFCSFTADLAATTVSHQCYPNICNFAFAVAVWHLILQQLLFYISCGYIFSDLPFQFYVWFCSSFYLPQWCLHICSLHLMLQFDAWSCSNFYLHQCCLHLCSFVFVIATSSLLLQLLFCTSTSYILTVLHLLLQLDVWSCSSFYLPQCCLHQFAFAFAVAVSSLTFKLLLFGSVLPTYLHQFCLHICISSAYIFAVSHLPLRFPDRFCIGVCFAFAVAGSRPFLQQLLSCISTAYTFAFLHLSMHLQTVSSCNGLHFATFADCSKVVIC